MTIRQETARALVEEIATLGRLVKAISGHHALALSPAQQGVLRLLAQRGECRQNELTAALGVGPSALSRQITELVSSGLVARRPDPEDGRAALISVSDVGATTLREASDRRSGQLAGLLDDWDEDEAQDALASLEHLVATFSSTTSTTSSTAGRRSPAPAPRPAPHSPEVVPQ